MPKISELAAATSASDADQLPANQGGTTRRVTVAQLRAGLAPLSHTHSIAEVAGLQATLDAKQPIDSDLTALANNTANGLWARTGNGTGAARSIVAGAGISVANGDGVAGNPTVSLNLTLANIPQSGATTGQVLKWNGTAWAPANDETGGTPSWGSISGIPVSVSAVGALTPAANTFPYYTGTSAAALGTVSAFALARLAEGSATEWLAALGIEGVTLGANQVAVKNNANTALEPRTQKVTASFAVPVTADGTVELAMWGDIPTTLSEVRIRTFAGTCSVQIQKNGTPISGFATAVAQGTTVTATASTESLAEDNRLTVVVTGAAGLTGLHIVLKGVRTGN